MTHHGSMSLKVEVSKIARQVDTTWKDRSRVVWWRPWEGGLQCQAEQDTSTSMGRKGPWAFLIRVACWGLHGHPEIQQVKEGDISKAPRRPLGDLQVPVNSSLWQEVSLFATQYFIVLLPDVCSLAPCCGGAAESIPSGFRDASLHECKAMQGLLDDSVRG